MKSRQDVRGSSLHPPPLCKQTDLLAVKVVPTAVSAPHVPHLLYWSSSPFSYDQICSHNSRFNSTLSVERPVSKRATVLFRFPPGKWDCKNVTAHTIMTYIIKASGYD